MADKSEMFKPVAGGKTKPAAGPTEVWISVLPVPDDAPKPPAAPRGYGKPSMRWTYLDEHSRLLGYNFRFDGSDGKKSFRPLTYFRHAENGKHSWRWFSWDSPRPLYGLERLGDDPSRPILLTEGEKDADAAHRMVGDVYACLTSPNGSSGVGQADGRAFKDRDVTIWPDNDIAGKKYADAIAALAIANGAASVCVL